MAHRYCDRLAEPEREESAEGQHVQRHPVQARDLIVDEVDSDEELVQETQGYGEVDVQVDRVPGFV